MTHGPLVHERSARSAALWLVLLLVGQASTLRLILAGPNTRYQHFVSPEQSWGDLPIAALMLLAIQAVAVLAGLFGARRDISVLLKGAGRWWALALGFGVCALSSAAPARDVELFALDLLFGAGVQLLHLCTVALFALALPQHALDGLDRLTKRVLGTPSVDGAPEPGGVDRFALVGAVWVTLAAAALAVFAYQRHPHIPDEVGYIFQARTFASGRLALPIPPVPAAFEIDPMMFHMGRWFTPTPAGWPLALAVGTFFEAGWLVNPVLAGLNVLLLYVLLRELYPRRTARLTVLLFCVSPWQLLLGMSFMTHHWSLACALLAAIAVGRMRRRPRVWLAIVGGAAIGMVSLIRPLEGIIVAVLLGLWSLGARGRWWRFGPAAVVTASTAAVGALVLLHNQYLTGSPRAFPVMLYFDRVFGPGANSLGFGANRGFPWEHDPFPGHGWRDALVNTALNTFANNVELLGWATGSLVVLALVFVRRLSRSDWFMLAVIFTVVTVHHFYWSAGGPDFGGRYWFLAIVPFLALTARGLEHFELMAGAGGSNQRSGAVLAAAAALAVGALLLFIPWRATDKYRDYRGAKVGIERLARDNDFGRGVVLVRAARRVDYSSALIYGALDTAQALPLYVWDRNLEVRDAVLRTFGNRPIWFVDGPSVTGDEYRVLAGPLTPEQAREIPSLAAPR